jgi:hypothetical protein
VISSEWGGRQERFHPSAAPVRIRTSTPLPAAAASRSIKLRSGAKYEFVMLQSLSRCCDGERIESFGGRTAKGRRGIEPSRPQTVFVRRQLCTPGDQHAGRLDPRRRERALEHACAIRFACWMSFAR